jgi:hypothetical protein
VARLITRRVTVGEATRGSLVARLHAAALLSSAFQRAATRHAAAERTPPARLPTLGLFASAGRSYSSRHPSTPPYLRCSMPPRVTRVTRGSCGNGSGIPAAAGTPRGLPACPAGCRPCASGVALRRSLFSFSLLWHPRREWLPQVFSAGVQAKWRSRSPRKHPVDPRCWPRCRHIDGRDTIHRMAEPASVAALRSGVLLCSRSPNSVIVPTTRSEHFFDSSIQATVDCVLTTLRSSR